jgi:hypothetical protein
VAIWFDWGEFGGTKIEHLRVLAFLHLHWILSGNSWRFPLYEFFLSVIIFHPNNKALASQFCHLLSDISLYKQDVRSGQCFV